MKPNDRSESGQVIVFLAVAFVALLGFATLALDVGMVYADRRNDQNAADAAALTGARKIANDIESQTFNCAGFTNIFNNAAAAAISNASANHFTLTNQTAAQLAASKNGVSITCNESGTPYIDVTVMITAQSTTSFLHIFSPEGKLINTVKAISRIHPKSPYAANYAVVALCTTCGDSLLFDGNIGVTINNGGVLSNDNMRKNGTSGGVHVYSGYVHYADSFVGTTAPFSPTQPSKGSAIPKPTIPKPNCNGLPNRTATSGNLQPGHYVNGINGDATLAPGLYCVDGGIVLNGNDVLAGSNVTIVMLSGVVRFNGNSYANLSAPTNSSYAPAQKGLLFYVDEGNSCNPNLCLSLGGTNDTRLSGTVFVPNGHLDLGGNNNTDAPYKAQFIARTIRLHGTPDLFINYDMNYLAVKPTNMELKQ